MRSRTFERFAGVCAIFVALVGIAYSVAFVIDARTGETWVDTVGEGLLLGGGLLTTAVFVGVYERLREVDPGFALLALVLGLAGAFGSAVHGAFNIANRIKGEPEAADLPNPVDPRGFFTFAVAGLALLVLGWLVAGATDVPRLLAALAYVAGLVLICVYVARLVDLDTEDPRLLVPAVVAGFFTNPLLYLWLGVVLIRSPRRR
jgi:hypothetical protein